MFGFVTASPSTLSEQEKSRYRELYCGLCLALKDRYGQLSRFCLTYDLTFYIMLCNSLHEPQEERGSVHCVAHSGRRVAFARSSFSDYAADLSVALAYHKLLDDVRDDCSLKAKAGASLLASAYEKAVQRIPDQCRAIEQAMQRTFEIESAAEPDPDAAANEFGKLLGSLFSCGQGAWSAQMAEFGLQLGRFVYFMDAAVDFADDAKSHSYNPFVRLGSTPEEMRELLAVLVGNASIVFEKLPLEQDLHILRSVLYSGVWLKFNKQYSGEGNHDRESV